MNDLAKFHDLLILCARAHEAPSPFGRGRGVRASVAHYDYLRQAAASLPAWDSIPSMAEAHGLTPLVYTHLQAAKITIPESIERELRARTMQHSHANRVRTGALAEILAAFQSAEIESLLLKGMAMAHAVYPRPGLRVMSDIDLLVGKSNAQQGQNILTELGFRPVNSGVPSPHHMPTLHKLVEGVPVYAELHHNLNRRLPPETGFKTLRMAAIPIIIDGTHSAAYTLAYEDMLAHTYAHIIAAPFQPFRLIWLADMISLVERFGDQINWERLPLRVYRALAAINWLTPFRLVLSEKVTLRSEIFPYRKVAQLRGWPFSVIPAQNRDEYLSNIPAAFRPSDWWLRFYYGLSLNHWLFGMSAPQLTSYRVDTPIPHPRPYC